MTTYDVFLSHASGDKPTVKALAQRLREDGIKPFLDEWHLVPGKSWQEGLEDALERSRTCAVFLGEKLGPWQNKEMRAALDERAGNDDFRVIPVLLPGASKPGKKGLPLFLRDLTWVDFRAGLDDDDAYYRLLCGIRDEAPDAGPAPATLAAPRPYRSMAPAPDQFVHRREFDAVRELLVDGAGGTVGITTALRGAGGFGKTALAQALCEDLAVRAAYPDGILWAQMRDDMRAADRLAVVQDVIRFWHREKQSFETLPAAAARLRELLDGERVLLVVDDAWSSADVEPFRGLGSAALLVTTRDGGTLPARCRRIDVDAMQPSEAVSLLTSGIDVDSGGRFKALARRLGEWPLLLRLVNRQLREILEEEGHSVEESLDAVEDELEASGVTGFDVDDEEARDKAVKRTLGVSLKRLEGRERRRFRDLAVFPEDADVPLDVLERFWELRTRDIRRLCKRLHRFSLLLRFDRAARTIRLHDVVRRYLVEEHDDLPGLHRRLLRQCRPPGSGWSGLADGETYLWRHLAVHLAGAGERAKLRSLLFDLDYLEGKVRTVGVNALLADYDVLGTAFPPLNPPKGTVDEARTVQEALRLSAHVLLRDWGGLLGQVLAGQLLGRLGPLHERGLLEKAADRVRLCPRHVRMTRPGGPLIRTLEGHTELINAVAVLDERRVVSASWDETLRVWDVESGETIRTLKGHTSGVSAVAVLDERRVVSASHDHTLRVWDVDSGETIRTLKGHTVDVLAVAVVDERRVVSASVDRTLRVWNIKSGETIRTLEGHTDEVRAVVVVGERRVVSASYDQTLRVWDVDSGETIRTLEHCTFRIHTVAILDESRVVLGSDDPILRVWDIDSGKTIRALETCPSMVRAVAILDKSRVVSGSDDHILRVWDIDSGQPIRTLEGHTNTVGAVTALLDGRRVVSASSDQTLRVWNVESGETIRTPEGHTSEVRAVAVVNERRVVSASYDQTRVWDVETGETIRTSEGSRTITVFDDRRVVVSASRGLRVWDIESGHTIRRIEGHAVPMSGVVVMDERRVVSTSRGQTWDVEVWDVKSGETIRTLEGHTSGVEAVAVVDARRVVSASIDQTLRVWDVETGETIHTLEGHTYGVVAVAVVDARRVVSSSVDQTLRVWDVESGKTIHTLEGHADVAEAVAVVDARCVVSASDDQTLRVWDVESGKTMAVFALDAPLSAVAVTADGCGVVAGDRLGGVHFLDLDLSC